jgi:hypothetical protein
VLGAILVLVLVYAARDITRRQARRVWDRPLEVGVVLVQAVAAPIEPATAALLQKRVSALKSALASEYTRYHPGSASLFHFQSFGPVSTAETLPSIEGEEWYAPVKQAYQLWRYTSALDRAGQVPSRGLDSRIYVLMEGIKDEREKFVEGFSQQGGHFGIARVQLDESTVDLALFVVAHELFHTLGATDKYGAAGNALIPEGLGDPNQVPLYPQLKTEVMARNRVLGRGKEAVPESLDELSVGPLTAREIGWIE